MDGVVSHYINADDVGGDELSDDALPLFLGEVLADAVGAECVVAELFDAVGCFAEDDVYDVA